jgi:phosphoribosylformylglycinamidine (FGAM) synthase-like enzyme
MSLYNETNGEGILPTPAIGGVGLLEDINKSMSISFKQAGEAIIVIGKTEGHLGCSTYLRDVLGRNEGTPPTVDLAAEKAHGAFVRDAIQAGRLTATHDVSDGGLLVALAKMAIAGQIGAHITPNADVPLQGW